MRIGSWLFCRPSDLTVTFYYPYSKKGKNMVFQPYFGLETPSGQIIVHGKRSLWSLLDSLFPDDPLPRPPINNDLKDATTGRNAINGLLNDPEAWPHLRLQVRTGDWKDPYGFPTKGTFLLSASPSASDFDMTPNLMLFEKSSNLSYMLPITIHTKTKLRTLPAVVVPLEGDPDFKVIITDAINGNHLIFSVIEKSGSCFRPQRMKSFPVSDIVRLTSDLKARMSYLAEIQSLNFLFPQMSALDAGMRFYERDDLEFRRFQSLNCFSSLNTAQKE
tara:strand:+ start:857 stop:1681 length:825 start_codon:yes stop_codon:yes gene_type:complete